MENIHAAGLAIDAMGLDISMELKMLGCKVVALELKAVRRRRKQRISCSTLSRRDNSASAATTKVGTCCTLLVLSREAGNDHEE